MSRHTLLATALTALAAAAPAQGPQLVVKTADPSIAEAALDLLGEDRELPRLKQGENWAVMLTKTGELKVDVERGLLLVAQITGRPSALMGRFADRISSFISSIEGPFGAILAHSPLSEAEAEAFFDALFGLMLQIDHIRVLVRDTGDAELDIQLWLRPAKGSWLATLIDATLIHVLPCPILADKDSLLSLRVAASTKDEKALRAAREVFAPFLLREGMDDDAGRQIVDRYWDSWGGVLSAVWDTEGHLAFVANAADPDKVRRLQTNPGWVDWMNSTAAETAQGTVTYTPNALSHHHVAIHKAVLRSGADPEQGPLLSESEITSYFGIAGDWFVGTSGDSEDAIKDLAERALGNAFPNKKLGESNVARIQTRFGEFAHMMSGGRIPADSLPQRLRITIANTGNQVLVKVKSR